MSGALEGPMPDLYEGELDEAGIDALFEALEGVPGGVEVIVKWRPGQAVPPQRARLDLAAARSIVARRQARAVQLRYRFEGEDWWDTLMLGPERVRVVRVRHRF